MKHKWKLFVCGISISLLLGGCFGVDSGKKSEAKKTDTKQGDQNYPAEEYESVLTYTGEGYFLPNGKETDKIAKSHREEVIKATKNYLSNEYNLEAEVHNMVGNKDGVTVFYETKGTLHFYGIVIVPINLQKKEVMAEEAFSPEGQVEDGIRGALYAYIMEDQFKALDEQLSTLIKTEEIVGRRVEAIENVGGSGYNPTLYNVVVAENEAMNPVYDLYTRNPKVSKKELQSAYKEEKFNPEDVYITIQAFMKKKGAEPDEKIFNKLVEIVQGNHPIPNGTYNVALHDNLIQKSTFEGLKMNSLDKPLIIHSSEQ
ncbi:DUF1672 family protein [Rossellomorea sp. FS2]|uniref:DUF1672 family protein n=1 Tax=Rossellomorea sp. FS2 TaxID=3391447 RepID=UPI003A4D9A68